ncbi:MAG: hypothetical protein HY547_02685 [Elusimicrobia bacterium]|nr:hypothetical protein [Elusimicrobiota bacterium]
MDQRGSILLEASITCLVLTLALVSLSSFFAMTVRGHEQIEQIAIATHLAGELLEEIRLRRWDETTPKPIESSITPSVLGLDTNEDPQNKRTFDDVDDFDGWMENAILDPMMRPWGFEGYSRDVAVRYVDDMLNPQKIPGAYKQVTVCARGRGLKPICLDTILTNR